MYHYLTGKIAEKRPMYSRHFFAFFLMIPMVFCTPAFAGKVELTTYYPAPRGEYDALSTTGDTHLATASGEVGVGTSTPNAKLDVKAEGILRSFSRCLFVLMEYIGMHRQM